MAPQIDSTERQTSKPFVIGVCTISVLYLGWALFTGPKPVRPNTAADNAAHVKTRMSLRVMR